MPDPLAPWKAHVRTLGDQTADLLAWAEPPSRAAVWSRVLALDRALRAVGEEAAAAMPLPTLDSVPDDAVDAAVEHVVRAELSGESPAADALERAASAGRVRVEDDRVVVPFESAGEPVANWYVLVRELCANLESLAEELRRVRGRLELVDYGTEASAVGDVREALEDTASVLEHLAARTLWLNPPEGLVDVDYERVREFAVDTTRAYNTYA